MAMSGSTFDSVVWPLGGDFWPEVLASGERRPELDRRYDSTPIRGGSP